jgi:hypothetical protein
VRDSERERERDRERDLFKKYIKAREWNLHEDPFHANAKLLHI